MVDYIKKYDLWLKNVKDENLLNQLKNMTEEEKNLAFFKDIEFGTAGLRGIVGVGTNCMNIYTVGNATKAVCQYLKSRNGKTIAISYDSRFMSKEFAQLVARICSYNGIKVYLADKMMPTPFLSYMVRYYHTDMGIMITASHNSKEYNGYKVYDNEGCQLLDEPSLEIMKISKSLNLFDLKCDDIKIMMRKNNLVFTDKVILKSYLDEVKKQGKGEINNLTVVYSALNGTGINTIPLLLKDCGVNVVLNKKQCHPDSNFSTCPYPNPENPEVFETSLPIAKQNNADLIILSDPDADRVGVEVLHNGDYIHLSGNEIGALLTDYLLSKYQNKNKVIVKSIVSTSLADKIAQKYGAECKNVLTGFKYIGKVVEELNKDNKNRFVLGFEESYGYLIGTYVRDKDATVASFIISEMVSEYKSQGKTLVDRLSELYDEFGYYEHIVKSYKFVGSSGAEKMAQVLNSLRNNPPKNFGKLKVISVLDYLKGVKSLPKANVIFVELEHNVNIIIRPSGTEPLIKFYITLADSKINNKRNLKILENEIKSFIYKN